MAAAHSVRFLFAYNQRMGGERSSTTRQRLAGKICSSCKAPLPPPHVPGERRCARCMAARSHRVYMSFMLRDVWHCVFLEEDLKTQLPKLLSFRDPRKIYEAAERGHALLDSEARLALEHGIEIGRGGIWLHLDNQQYASLRRERPPT